MAEKKWPIYLGIFFLSLATLSFEISIIRLLSVSRWYHFAFMVVSISLLGFGASGSFLALFPSLLKKDTNRVLFVFSLIFSLTITGSYALANRIPFDPSRIAWDRNQILYIFIYYVLLIVPFFASGICIGLLLTKMVREVNRVYCFNLIGSAAGALLAILISSYLSGSSVIILTSSIAALAALSFSLRLSRRLFLLSLSLAIIFLSLAIKTPSFLRIKISPYKTLSVALSYPNAKTLFTKWNSFSRIDLIESPLVRYAPGLSYQYKGQLPHQIGMTIDGEGINALTAAEDPSKLDFLSYLPSSLPYKLKEKPQVLIIDPGGGLDVLTALRNEVSSIDVVEMNPIILDIIKNKYREFTGNLYAHEKVNVYLSEGRSFLKRVEKEYDLIQFSSLRTTSASSTGLYALSENYTFTTEAFRDYYSHLSPGGYLALTGYLLPPPREDIRLVSLAIAALEEEGANPRESLTIIRSWGTITILLKKGAILPEEIETIKRFAREKRFDLIYLPGINPSQVNIYNRFSRPYYYEMVQKLLGPERSKLYRDYLFDISPVTDDRPFFYLFLRWGKLIPLYKSVGEKWQPFVEGGYLVPVIFFQALFLSAVLIILPVYSLRKLRERISGKIPLLIYFFSLGLGFMFMEISLIQRFILFFGHPVYAISVVISSLLLFSGLGSLVSGRFPPRSLKFLIPILAGIILLYLLFLPSLLKVSLGWRLVERAILSFLYLAPLGFLMGFPFPLGIRLAHQRHPHLVSWAWAVNGCASVLGSILPVMIALSLGFSTVFGGAAMAYLGGWVMILLFERFSN